MHARLLRQSRELAALHDAALGREERLRIADEMHDGLAQVLAYVNAKAQTVREYLRSGRPEQAERQLDQLAAAAREVYGDVRELIVGLRAAAQEGPLAEALRQLLASWRERAEIPYRLDVDEGLSIPSATQLQLLRIVQEALANVRKHPRARRVEVSVVSADGQLAVTVSDDGVGFDPSLLDPAELPRLRSRHHAREGRGPGGSVRITAAAQEGTRVDIRVPVQVSGTVEPKIDP